jgi:hypothetical protein
MVNLTSWWNGVAVLVVVALIFFYIKNKFSGK